MPKHEITEADAAFFNNAAANGLVPETAEPEADTERAPGIMIRLNADDYKALAEMAQQEYRTINQQAAQLVASACRLGGLAMVDRTPPGADPPPWFYQERASVLAQIAQVASELEPADEAIRLQNKAIRMVSDTLDKLGAS